MQYCTHLQERCSEKNTSQAEFIPHTNSQGFRYEWILQSLCVVFGAILVTTTRHFVNGDAIAYLDMAEAVRYGSWGDMLNLHYSPGYALLLGYLFKIFNIAPENELFVAKGLNFTSYLFSLLALNLLLKEIRKDSELSEDQSVTPISWSLFYVTAYALFFQMALNYVRIQVVSPDMLILGFILWTAALLVSIKRSADYYKFFSLGLVMGMGYLCKTLFFPLTPFFLVLSALYCSSIRKALPRVALAGLVFLIVSAPLLFSLSDRLGRFSFGEAGNFNYTYFVSAKGTPVHRPEIIWNVPHVEVYTGGSAVATHPLGFDPSYWIEGLRASFDLRSQINSFWKNTIAFLEFNTWLYVIFLVWSCYQFTLAESYVLRIRPPSLSILFATIALSGIGMFTLVYFESRYVAPFVFLGLVAVLLCPRYSLENHGKLRSVQIITSILAGTILVGVLGSMWDQSTRALHDRVGKTSHRTMFMEAMAVRDFLCSHGIQRNDLVATVGEPQHGIFWSKLSGTRARASVTNPKEFFAAPSSERVGILDRLSSKGFKAVVATDSSFTSLENEGWSRVPSTENYFVRLLAPDL